MTDQVALAHGAGWDELLFVGVPLVAFALFRWIALRRERNREPAEPAREDPG